MNNDNNNNVVVITTYSWYQLAHYIILLVSRLDNTLDVRIFLKHGKGISQEKKSCFFAYKI